MFWRTRICPSSIIVQNKNIEQNANKIKKILHNKGSNTELWSTPEILLKIFELRPRHNPKNNLLEDIYERKIVTYDSYS